MVSFLLTVFSFGTAVAVPVVNLQEPDASTKLVAAAQQWGAAYIKGHNVASSVLSDAEDSAREFFGLSQNEKNTLLADKSKALKTARGYAGVRGEQLDITQEGRPDLKEVLDIGLSRVNGSDPYLGPNQVPPSLPAFAANIQTVGEEMSMVASRIIDFLADGLGASGALSDAFADGLRVQRLTRYPAYSDIFPRRAAASEISCGAHTDYGGLTLVHADTAGLAVLKPNANGTKLDSGTFFSDLSVRHLDEWVDVPPVAGSLVVMFGEALQVLTNDRIPSTRHRVDVDGGVARQSLTFFYDPNPDFMLAPLPAFSDEKEAVYEPRIAGHKGVLLAAAATLSKMPFVGYGKV